MPEISTVAMLVSSVYEIVAFLPVDSHIGSSSSAGSTLLCCNFPLQGNFVQLHICVVLYNYKVSHLEALFLLHRPVCWFRRRNMASEV